MLLAACQPAPDTPEEPHRVLERVSWEELRGWEHGAQGMAVKALLRSCARLSNSDPHKPLDNHEFAGPVGLWIDACDQAALIDQHDHAQARAFFEAQFDVVSVRNNDDPTGLFTGYFEPELDGAIQPSDRHHVPLLAMPDDIIKLEVDAFRSNADGEKLTGRIDGNRFVPYFSRAEIVNGALSGRGLELIWVDDRIEKFFLQIQGSGRVRLDDGRIVRVGYAGQNGHAYRAIGRDLIEQGEIERADISLQSIDRWLRDHPDRAQAMMNNNASYVFFQTLDMIKDDEGPLGAQSVPLTPEHSLAIDRAFLPLGIPVWLETSVSEQNVTSDFQQLLITQDTGGAIKGPVRGDVFWGAGERAKTRAGGMKSDGRYYLLLPRALFAAS